MSWLFELIPYLLWYQAGYDAGLHAHQVQVIAAQHAPVVVTKVVDGDTIYVTQNGVSLKLRFLRINTPERKKPGYKEATEALRGILLAAKKITIEYEEVGVVAKDRYGRDLVYVYADGKNVNLEMMKLGWSPLYLRYGAGRLGADFEKAFEEAVAAKRGLWK